MSQYLSIGWSAPGLSVGADNCRSAASQSILKLNMHVWVFVLFSQNQLFGSGAWAVWRIYKYVSIRSKIEHVHPCFISLNLWLRESEIQELDRTLHPPTTFKFSQKPLATPISHLWWILWCRCAFTISETAKTILQPWVIRSIWWKRSLTLVLVWVNTRGQQ